jgi:hypothetical protein
VNGESEAKRKAAATLGDVLYARSKDPVPEQAWVALVQPGESDQRVFGETGCTSVLITSTDDVLRSP